MKTLFIILSVFGVYGNILLAQVTQVDYNHCTNCPQGMNTNTSVSDTLFQYNNTTSFNAGDIESDFDLRRAGVNTRWHKGVDYRNHGQGADMQRGDAIISPEAGTIVHLPNQRYKYIIVDGDDYDFGYGHIFSHHNITNTSTWRSGNFVLKMTEVDDNNQRFLAIVNINTCVSYCREDDKAIIIHNNPHCNDTLITTSQITNRAAFAPIGGSQTNVSADISVHLHLYKFRNPVNGISLQNCMDPLVNAQHPNTDFDIKLTTNSSIEANNFQNWNNEIINYPGTNSNSVSLRAIMGNAISGVDSSRYTNVVHNLDSIQIVLKKMAEDSFKVIIGPNYRSEFLLHAKENTPLYPTNLVSHYGNQTTTGISPRAYQDGVGFRPYDNYYFSDFITRIHRNDPMDGNTTPTMIAYCPQSARYNDGKYQLKAVVKDVRYDSSATDAADHIFEGPRNDDDELEPIEFVLDNIILVRFVLSVVTNGF